MKTIALIMLLAVGCSDTAENDPWSFSENAPDSGSSPDASGTQEQDGSTAPDYGPTERLPKCVTSTQPVIFSAFGQDDLGMPMIANESVFVMGPSGAEDVLLRWTPDGLEPLVDGVQSVIGGSREAVWANLGRGFTRVDLPQGSLAPISPVATPRSRFGPFAQARQNAFGRRVAWVDGTELVLVDDETTTSLASDAVGGTPWVTARVTAYEFQSVDGRRGIRASGRDEFEFVGAGESGWPVATNDDVFFIHRTELMAAKLTGANAEPVLRDMACGPPYAADTAVVTACNPSTSPIFGDRPDYLSLNASELWIVDAATRHPTLAHTASDHSIYGPVVTEKWIVWAEYPPEVGSIDIRSGRILALPRGQVSAEPIEVGYIGVGCPYCGAYWAPPRLLVDGDVVAWSYATQVDADAGPGPRDSYGISYLASCDL